MPSTIQETTSPPVRRITVTVRDISPPQPARRGRYRWWTTIGEHWTITQGNALYDYRLYPRDLKGLYFTQHPVMHGHERHFYYKYKELEVLMQAWTKHGGPRGFWRVLKRRRDTLLMDPVELRAFDEHAPQDYRRGMLYDITKPFFTPPPGHFYHRLPALHKTAYNRLGPRTYGACVEALKHTEWPASPDDPYTEEVAEDGTVTVRPVHIPLRRRPEAHAAVEAAVHFFAAYPTRPTAPLQSASIPTARAIDAVRDALREAPRAPRRGTAAWGSAVEKLEFVDEPAPGHYEWDAEYLERVFASLCALIERDPSTWEAIRWEVYDKYLTSVPLRTVLRYDAVQLLWCDPAATAWLAAQLPPDELWRGLRGKCASGERYNELLGRGVVP